MKRSLFMVVLLLVLGVGVGVGVGFGVSIGGKFHAPESEPDVSLAKPAPSGLRDNRRPLAIDGSSTVYPISLAMVAAFRKNTGREIVVQAHGTTRGFRKLCSGQVIISEASRPINASEAKECERAGHPFIEIPIAYDGIAVVVNKQADWLDSLTVGELETIWAPESEGVITKWSDVRSGWPEEPLLLLGHSENSGTYDYFTKAIVGVEHSSRRDFKSDSRTLSTVSDIVNNLGALGFLAYPYYEKNRDQLKLLAIDDGEDGKGAISPSKESIANGSYQPLSRVLFLYVDASALRRSEVAEFVTFYLAHVLSAVAETGYVPLSESAYNLVTKRITRKIVGSMFVDKALDGASIESRLVL